jgi:protein phosphatase
MDVAVGFEPGGAACGDAHLSEVLAPNVSFFCVAHGFGSCGRSGPVAALALTTMRDYLRRKVRGSGANGQTLAPGNVRGLLVGALEHANARLFELGGSNADFVANGASVTGALVAGEHAFVGHVGDARAYLLRLGRVEMLTVDDAMTLDTVPSTAIGAIARPRRRLLWRSLGTQAKLEASIAHVELIPGDRLVLCTDGFHRALGSDELGSALADEANSSDLVARLLQVVRARGIRQNATLVIARDLLAADPASNPRTIPLRRVASAVALIVTLALGWLWVVAEHPSQGTPPPAQSTQQQVAR